MANIFDQFDQPKKAETPKNIFDQFDAEKPGVIEDVAKTVPAGLARGTAGLLGAPWDLTRFGAGGVKYLERLITGETEEQQEARYQKSIPGYGRKPEDFGSQRLTSEIEKATGPLHKPQTTAGEYANTVAEFAPGAATLGAGGILPRIAQAVVPGVATEAAGQATRKVAPGAEGMVRAGTAIVTGGGTALATAPRTAERAIAGAIQGVDDAGLRQAQALIDDAAAMGVRLTWDEAIQQVTGGATRLGDLRRVVENSSGGGAVLKPMMAERPAQVQAAGDAAVGGIAPQRMAPDVAGLANQRSATREIADAQTTINAATRPDYDAAGRQNIAPGRLAALRADPLYAATLHEIRNDPGLNRTIAGLPDDSVAVVDLVQRRMRETAEAARMPGQANTSNLRATNVEQARTPAIEAAEEATGGRYGDYARARQTQQTLRQNLLEPLEQGPVGAVSRTGDLPAQGKAVLPSQPAPGTEQVVAQAVGRLSRQDPVAAQNLVHSHVRSVFDEATQNNLPGANQFGGAKFAAVIAGNSQQARNLEAAIRALPNGHMRWEGFRRFLDVMEATGQRPAQGSATAFNQELQQALKQGGLASDAAQAAKTGGMSMFKRFNDFREQLNLGRNTEQIARILADPASGRLLARLAAEPPGSGRALILALRLSYMGRTGYKSAPQNRD